MTFRWCLSDVTVMSLVMSPSCFGFVAVVSQRCFGDVSVMSRYCFGIVGDGFICFREVTVVWGAV